MKLPDPPPPEHVILDDPREINRRLRDERKAARVLESGMNGFGIFRDILEDVCSKHSGNPKRQLARFLEAANRRGIPARTGRKRALGEKRKTEFGRALFMSLEDLKHVNCAIQNLDELNQDLVVKLVGYWGDEKELSEGSIQDLTSSLRNFLTFCGKPIEVRSGWRLKLKAKGVLAGTIGRSNIAVIQKGWRDCGVDPDAVICSVRQYCEIVACHLELMYMFGLRCEECLQFAPFESDKGTHIEVIHGTKGKKRRTVKFSSEPAKAARQRAALDLAKALAMSHPAKKMSRKKLGIPGKTLEQMRNHQRYVFRKFKIFVNTELGGLGVTPHGLRHQFACDLHVELTGMPAPVLGLLSAENYARQAELIATAMQEISEQLGHERPAISAAYVANHRALGRKQRNRLESTLASVESAYPVLRAARVSDIWLTGRAGEGMELLDGQPATFLVRFADALLPLDQVTDRLDNLRDALQDALKRAAVVAPWVSAGVPDGATEVMFAA